MGTTNSKTQSRPNRKAKIVATIGPATNSLEKLRELVNAGVDVVRLNFSHGDHNHHAQAIHHIRQIREESNRAVTILQDLSGPKLRTGPLLKPDEKVLLEAGNRFILTAQHTPGTTEKISVNYPAITEDIAPDDRILLDDGRLELRVIKVAGSEVHTEVVVGGRLGSNKGINLPGVAISAPALTSKDKLDLAFGLEAGVDAVAMSFVHRAEDLHLLRSEMQACCPERKDIPMIAKLERPDAIERLDSILEACDGVMVARGDLGVEVSPECVPSLQKTIIQKANTKLRIVITATQMLESMMDSPRPTRAEASDVANAIFDGSDALMLSGETAIGNYPLETVLTMGRIIADAEEHASEWSRRIAKDVISTSDDALATTHAASMLAHNRNVAAIAVFTQSGHTASLMAKVRPEVPILAFTPESKTYQLMALFWGIVPHLVPKAHSVEEMISRVREVGLASGTFQPGQQVVLVASLPIGAMGPPNFTLLHTIE